MYDNMFSPVGLDLIQGWVFLRGFRTWEPKVTELTWQEET